MKKVYKGREKSVVRDFKVVALYSLKLSLHLQGSETVHKSFSVKHSHQYQIILDFGC